MGRCTTCGRHVSDRFARVFGDNEDEVHGCPACATQRDLYAGLTEGDTVPDGDW
jgi:hypothetical protein